MKNYSKQRAAILDVLRNSENHPSALEVYEEVKKTIPNISLGTVYRNLSALRENGDILSVSVDLGNEKFDGRMSPHIHLYCRKCGKLTDLPIKEDIYKMYSTEVGFTPDTSSYVVYGVCKDCSEK